MIAILFFSTLLYFLSGGKKNVLNLQLKCNSKEYIINEKHYSDTCLNSKVDFIHRTIAISTGTTATGFWSKGERLVSTPNPTRESGNL